MKILKIGEKILENANTYIPADKKREFIDAAAVKCIDKIEVKYDESAQMPPVFAINMQRRARYLMGAFLRLYLNVLFECEGEDGYLITKDLFDAYGAGHIFNDVDRMKRRDAASRDKAFDLLEDFGALKREFCAETESLLAVMNDPCTRLMQMMFMQSTPQAIKHGQKELNALFDDLKKYSQKAQEGIRQNG